MVEMVMDETLFSRLAANSYNPANPQQRLSDLLMSGSAIPQQPSGYDSMVGALEGARNVLGGPPTVSGSLNLAMAAIPGARLAGFGAFAAKPVAETAAANLYHAMGGDYAKAIAMVSRREGASSPVAATLAEWQASGFRPPTPKIASTAADDAALVASDRAAPGPASSATLESEALFARRKR